MICSPAFSLDARHGRRRLVGLAGALAVVVGVSAVFSGGADAAEPAAIDFATQIAPLFEGRCLRCHQPSKREGELSLATAEDLLASGLITPGKSAESPLLGVLTPQEGQPPRMPKEGQPLDAEAVARLRDWIDAGAVWPEGLVLHERAKADRNWWSLAPAVEAPPPEVPAATLGSLPGQWATHPIDRFVLARLDQEGLLPNPPADRAVLIRRLTYDLTGLPPTPEEVAQFVADPAADAYERLVDRLLASPHYGEHWGRHWLDVVRFGESTGFERNTLVNNAWPFRDYVIRSLNDDKPFDQLITEHLAGDVVGSGQPEVEVATTFLVAGPYDAVGNQDPAQAAIIRANVLDEVIRATSEAFLGLTVGCARCHNHKFDPITQRDYYALYATLAGVHHGAREVATAEARQARASRLAPLEARRNGLVGQVAALREAVQQRAEAAAPEIEPLWIRPPAERYGTEERFPPLAARFVRLVVLATDVRPESQADFRLDEFEVWTAGAAPANVALASSGAKATGPSRTAADFREAYDPRLAIDGVYGARWIAAGPVLTIELARPEIVERVVFSSDRQRELGPTDYNTTFPGDYRIELSLDGEHWSLAAASGDRRPATPQLRAWRLTQAVTTADDRRRLSEVEARRAAIEAEIQAVPPLDVWWVGQFRSADGPFRVFQGGDPQRPGDEVAARSLEVLADLDSRYELPGPTPEAQRRLALARWITANDNPLAARVLANRVWHYHFGTGLVDTPSDFGYMGGRPTHPALLDWLAGQLRAGGWRLKPLHRQIVLSQTYRQAGTARAEALARDADSRLLWRFPPRRLSAEEVRDTLLAVSGKLDPTMGGPGFQLYRYLEDNVATYVPLDQVGPGTYRRAVYHQNARAAQVDVLGEFDCPDPAFPAPRRAHTTTPLQALTLLNHSFTRDMAQALTQRLEAAHPGDAASQISLAFRLCYGRGPTAQETADAAVLVAQHGLPALARGLLNSSELIYVQ